MPKLLISLIGGRATPSLKLYLHQGYDKFIALASRDSLQRGPSMHLLTGQIDRALRPHEVHSVDPYSMSETAELLEKLYQEHAANYQIDLQSASEPKIMTMSAFRWAEQKQDKIRFLSSALDKGEIQVFKPEEEPLQTKIDLSDYCRAYSWGEISYQEDLPEKYEELFAFIEDNLAAYAALTANLRHLTLSDSKKSFSPSKLRLADHALLLRPELSHYYKRASGSQDERIFKEEAARFFLTGDWLEYLIYRQAKRLPIFRAFDSFAWNIKDLSGNWELDFLGIRDGRASIVSCKTNRNVGSIKQQLYQELSARRTQFGLDSCSTYLCLAILRSSLQGPKAQALLDWEKSYRVKTLFIEDLQENKVFTLA